MLQGPKLFYFYSVEYSSYRSVFKIAINWHKIPICMQRANNILSKSVS
jgi:hypothetical protein